MRRLLTKMLMCASVAASVFMVNVPTLNAQTVAFWQNAGTANWWTGNANQIDPNWDGLNGMFVPTSAFDEQAAITNGGTAFVNDQPPEVGDVGVGAVAFGANSTLEIRSGGDLRVVNDVPGASNVTASVGVGIDVDGSGTVNVLGGGRLEVGVNFVSGPTGIVRVENGSTFEVGNDFILDAGSKFTPAIDSATFSSIKVAEDLELAGTLAMEFNGVTPSPGDSWDLFDANAVSGSFNNILLEAAAFPEPGTNYFVGETSGGTNGTLVQLRLEQLVTLRVNRSSGAMALVNSASAGDALELDGYVIRSAAGRLNDASWNSLEDQSIGDWQESNPTTATRFAETNPTGSSTIALGGSLSLGNGYTPFVPTGFGELPVEDLEFDYVGPDGSELSGIVEYVGNSNTLVLTVDPATGEAQLENQSSFSATIDAYTISSASGSLQFANGTWSSLDDQNEGTGTWQESNPSAERISETDPTGATLLTSGTTFDLGTPFNPLGQLDLEFGFLLAGEDTLRTGIVQYGAIPVTVPGDFDGDGDVDVFDALVWQRTDGTPGGLSDWETNFGTGAALSAVTSVPEPSATLMVSLALMFGSMRVRAKKPEA